MYKEVVRLKIKTKNKTTMIFFIVIVVFCMVGFVWQRYFWFDLQYDGYITQCCNEQKVSKSLVYAIVKAESNFNTKALSNKGAVGLMQLMPDTALFVAQKQNITNFDLTNPKDNLLLGICYIAYLQQKFNSQKDVVCAYNAGENNVKQWLQNGQEIQFNETKNYLKKVERNIKIFNALIK